VGWNPDTKTVSLNNMPFNLGNIPGVYFNPSTGTNYVTNPAALSALFPAQTTQQVQRQPQAQASQGQPVQYGFNYEKLLNDLLASMPTYTQPSESDLLTQAQQWAQLQIQPQQEAVQRALEQAQQAYTARKADIEAAYGGLDQQTQTLLQELGRQAQESAIARGGGQSGAVEWLKKQYQTPVLDQYATARAQEAASLSNLAGEEQLTEQQYAQQQQQLAQQLGTMQAERLAELRDLAHATAVGDWSKAFEAAQNIADLAMRYQLTQQELAAGQTPYYTTSEEYRQGQPAAWTETVGQTPAVTPTMNAPAPSLYTLRDYAASQGASIGYDPSTRSVIINGRSYTPSDLSNMGGQLVDGRWKLPESAIRTLISY
jgi:hypothetical protein